MVNIVLKGRIVDSTSLKGIVVQSKFRVGAQLLELAASDGEQIFTITEVDTIVIIALPLKTGQTAGKVKTIIATLTSKAAPNGVPTSVDIEILDSDTPSLADPNEVFRLPKGGSKTIFLTSPSIPLTGTLASPLADEEPLFNANRVAERVFSTKGTQGNLGMAIRFNGGDSQDFIYIGKIQVSGEVLTP